MWRWGFPNTLLSTVTRWCTWKAISRKICDHCKLMMCRSERETKHLSCQRGFELGGHFTVSTAPYPPQTRVRLVQKRSLNYCLSSKANTSRLAELFASALSLLQIPLESRLGWVGSPWRSEAKRKGWRAHTIEDRDISAFVSFLEGRRGCLP